ncbi:MAG: sel1 repeat family protein [Deltaproteobacteria bacterium]|nr:sel1 repeat family protein [Deltaproteobacteria bacterium]
MARTLTLAALGLTAALTLAGCPDYEKMATERLAHEGYEGAALTEQQGAGHSYGFTATREGLPCEGTITVTAMPGSSAADFSTDARCKAPQKPAGEDEAPEDPLAPEQAACDKGDLAACTRLGVALVEGTLGQRDLERARRVHLKACEAGALKSCNALGTLHLRGLGGEQDEERAEELFTRSCDGDDMDGCALLGRLRFINRQGKEARALLKRSCEGGSFIGCDGLGAAYREGVGGDEDMAEAKRYFQMACDGGEPSGCGNLGTMFLRGEGGVKSAERARELLERACKGGVTAACDEWKRVP